MSNRKTSPPTSLRVPRQPSLIDILHPELIDAIIDNVADICHDIAIRPVYDPIMPPCHKALLRTCALVCRAFLPRSRYYLFDTLVVENKEDGGEAPTSTYRSKNYRWTRFAPPSPPTPATMARLQFYANRLDISQHVRFLFIYLDSDPGGIWIRARSTIIQHLRQSPARLSSIVIIGRSDVRIDQNIEQDILQPLSRMGGSTITSIRFAVVGNLPLDLLFHFPKAQTIELKAATFRHPTRETITAFRSWTARLPRASPRLLILNFGTMRSPLLASLFAYLTFSALDLSQLVHFCAFAITPHSGLFQYHLVRYLVEKCRRIRTIEMMPDLSALSTMTANPFGVRIDFSPLRSLSTFKFFFSCVVNPPGVFVRDAVRSFSRFLSTFHFPATLAHFHIQIQINCTRVSNTPGFLLHVDWQPLDEQFSRIYQDRGNTAPLYITLEFYYNTGNNPIALPPLPPRAREEMLRSGESPESWVRSRIVSITKNDKVKDVEIGKLVFDFLFLSQLPLKFTATRRHPGIVFNLTYQVINRFTDPK